LSELYFVAKDTISVSCLCPSYRAWLASQSLVATVNLSAICNLFTNEKASLLNVFVNFRESFVPVLFFLHEEWKISIKESDYKCLSLPWCSYLGLSWWDSDIGGIIDPLGIVQIHRTQNNTTQEQALRPTKHAPIHGFYPSDSRSCVLSRYTLNVTNVPASTTPSDSEFQAPTTLCVINGGTMVSTAASQRQGPGFDSRLGHCLCGVYTLSPWLRGFPPGCSGFLPQSQRCAG